MKVRVLLTGRSYHAAENLPNELSLPEGASLDDALNALRQVASRDNLVPPSCMIAVSGQHIGTMDEHEEVALKDGDELLFLAPVAGG